MPKDRLELGVGWMGVVHCRMRTITRSIWGHWELAGVLDIRVEL
jgi:hypothetical protein